VRIRVLDEATLHGFERALARQPGALLEQLTPGLAIAEIEEAFAGARIRPSEEAVLWWHWRNGARRLDVLPGFRMSSLAGALRAYWTLRGIVERQGRDAGVDPDTWWNRGWVPIFDTGGQDDIAIDCTGPANGPSPLRQVDFQAISESHFASVFAPSLGDFIARATHALDADRYRYDPDHNTWLPRDWSTMPPGTWC
jgi:hypothetical protein